jgi:hypothetical protein
MNKVNFLLNNDNFKQLHHLNKFDPVEFNLFINLLNEYEEIVLKKAAMNAKLKVYNLDEEVPTAVIKESHHSRKEENDSIVVCMDSIINTKL